MELPFAGKMSGSPNGIFNLNVQPAPVSEDAPRTPEVSSENEDLRSTLSKREKKITEL